MTNDILDESAAITKIEQLGGTLTRDESLRRRPVAEVFTNAVGFKDEDLSLLQSFPGLKIVRLLIAYGCCRETGLRVKELDGTQAHGHEDHGCQCQGYR